MYTTSDRINKNGKTFFSINYIIDAIFYKFVNWEENLYYIPLSMWLVPNFQTASKYTKRAKLYAKVLR